MPSSLFEDSYRDWTVCFLILATFIGKKKNALAWCTQTSYSVKGEQNSLKSWNRKFCTDVPTFWTHDVLDSGEIYLGKWRWVPILTISMHYCTHGDPCMFHAIVLSSSWALTWVLTLAKHFMIEMMLIQTWHDAQLLGLSFSCLTKKVKIMYLHLLTSRV